MLIVPPSGAAARSATAQSDTSGVMEVPLSGNETPLRWRHSRISTPGTFASISPCSGGLTNPRQSRGSGRQCSPPAFDARSAGSGASMATKRVADLIVETLAGAGVQRIYGIAGDSLNGVTDSLRRHD